MAIINARHWFACVMAIDKPPVRHQSYQKAIVRQNSYRMNLFVREDKNRLLAIRCLQLQGSLVAHRSAVSSVHPEGAEQLAHKNFGNQHWSVYVRQAELSVG